MVNFWLVPIIELISNPDNKVSLLVFSIFIGQNADLTTLQRSTVVVNSVGHIRFFPAPNVEFSFSCHACVVHIVYWVGRPLVPKVL